VAAVLITTSKAVSSKSIEDACNQVSVFGDDILLPKQSCVLLMSLLEALGLRVNEAKTYYNGLFRESCGIDAFGGDTVGPSYMLNPSSAVSPGTLASYIEVENNFFMDGWWNTASWLSTHIRRYDNYIPVIASTSGAVGRKSFCGYDPTPLTKRRWNKVLQRHEAMVLTAKCSQDLLPTCGSFRLFQWFIEKPLPDTNWKSGTLGRPVSYMRPGWVPLDIVAELNMLPLERDIRGSF
jgi:hypothetical protein